MHPGDLSTLELDFDDAEQRWTNACRQKIQALRVKLTDMRAHTAPDAHEFVLPERRVEGGAPDVVASTRILAPHYFIYLASGESMASGSGHDDVANVSQTTPLPQLQLRAGNYIGGWLQEENVEVAAPTSRRPDRRYPHSSAGFRASSRCDASRRATRARRFQSTACSRQARASVS
ncbi:hypothetical protein [Paraburkholderia terrae]|uniref:hypothetical protein n=1 Tax=Paraburkholderia terrae TaxID=311230 RepID=UPI002057CFB8|nr:hypothetical protein [Paraburkholderia terrae]BDC38684.1 hypothetical protein PTKU15_19810 [Paraburkholderia terrae]